MRLKSTEFGIDKIQRIHNYRSMYYPGMTRVYTIVKQRKVVLAPSVIDTFFYSVPVRDRREESDVNCVVAFLCPEYADIYCDALNRTTGGVSNDQEHGASHGIVSEYTISDLSFWAFQLRMSTAVICNSYCEGSQREPFYDLMVVDKPVIV